MFRCSTCLDLFFLVFFFFNDTATTEIYTLSLHDALPISTVWRAAGAACASAAACRAPTDRKSTRLNSSHQKSSYAVFCLKKKKKNHQHIYHDQYTQRRNVTTVVGIDK